MRFESNGESVEVRRIMKKYLYKLWERLGKSFSHLAMKIG